MATVVFCVLMGNAWAQNSVQGLAAKAEQLEAQGKWAQAATAYESILKIRPYSLAALNRLGALYVNHHHYREGIRYYQRALQASPTEYVTNLNLGIAYIKMADFPLAVVPLKEAAAVQPSSFQAHELLAVASLGVGDYATAIQQLLEAEQIGPQDVSTQYLLIRAYMATKNFRKALGAFDRLESLAPRSLWVHILKSQAYEGTGAYSEALQELEVAERQAPHNALVHFSLGFIYWKTDRFSQAETEFVRTLQLDSEFEEARFYLADCYLKQENPKSALPLFEEVAGSEPRDFWTRVELGKSLLELGLYNDAVGQFQAAIQLRPTVAEAHYLLGRTYQKMKRMNAYRHELEIAQKLQSEKLVQIESLMDASGSRGDPTHEFPPSPPRQ